jgi:hypothetical protein
MRCSCLSRAVGKALQQCLGDGFHALGTQLKEQAHIRDTRRRTGVSGAQHQRPKNLPHCGAGGIERRKIAVGDRARKKQPQAVPL